MHKIKYFIILGFAGLFMFTSCKSESESETISTTEVSWLSMSDVESKMDKKKKKVVVDIYTPWCGPCKMMDRTTFADEEVIKTMNGDFYPVKFNAEGADAITFKGKQYSNPNYDPAKARRRNSKHQLAPFFNVRGYPSVVVLDENFNIVEKLTGYKKPNQLLEALAKHNS